MSPCGRSPSSLRHWPPVLPLLRNSCSISSVVRVLADDSFRHRGPATPERVVHQVRGETIKRLTSGGMVRGVIRRTQCLRNHVGSAHPLGGTHLLSKKRDLRPALLRALP